MDVPSARKLSQWRAIDDDEHIFQLHVREAVVCLANKEMYCFKFANYDTPKWLKEQVCLHFTEEKGYGTLETKRFLIVAVQHKK